MIQRKTRQKMSPVNRSPIAKQNTSINLQSNKFQSLINFQTITIHYCFGLKYLSKSHAPVKGQVHTQPK